MRRRSSRGGVDLSLTVSGSGVHVVMGDTEVMVDEVERETSLETGTVSSFACRMRLETLCRRKQNKLYPV